MLDPNKTTAAPPVRRTRSLRQAARLPAFRASAPAGHDREVVVTIRVRSAAIDMGDDVFADWLFPPRSIQGFTASDKGDGVHQDPPVSPFLF
jgi:hypothetical protein